MINNNLDKLTMMQTNSLKVQELSESINLCIEQIKPLLQDKCIALSDRWEALYADKGKYVYFVNIVSQLEWFYKEFIKDPYYNHADYEDIVNFFNDKTDHNLSNIYKLKEEILALGYGGYEYDW